MPERSPAEAALDDGVLDLFLSYDWPGNVRELEP
jgi:transcriptional regulator with PAS, ATPase and Fis domain